MLHPRLVVWSQRLVLWSQRLVLWSQRLGAVEPELGAMDPEAGAVESDVGVATPECNHDGNAGGKAYHKTWQAEDCDCVEGKYSTKYRDALRKFYYSSVDMRKKWPSEREKNEFQLLVDFIK